MLDTYRSFLLRSFFLGSAGFFAWGGKECHLGFDTLVLLNVFLFCLFNAPSSLRGRRERATPSPFPSEDSSQPKSVPPAPQNLNRQAECL